MYSPREVHLKLHINNLVHLCSLPSVRYTQEQSSDCITHDLRMNKVSIEYKKIREFNIN